MGIGGIGSRVGYNGITCVLALALFFSVASIVLQPSYQTTHEMSGEIQLSFELCPIRDKVYYSDFMLYYPTDANTVPTKVSAMCDQTSPGAYNPLTGVTRKDAKKFQDWEFATVPIPAGDILRVPQVTLKSHALNVGSSDNKLDFMMFTGTKSADWITIHTFPSISTSLPYPDYDWSIPQNPKTNSDWTATTGSNIVRSCYAGDQRN